MSLGECATPNPTRVEGRVEGIGAAKSDDGLKSPCEGKVGVICGNTMGEAAKITAGDHRGEDRVYTLVQLSTRYAHVRHAIIKRVLEAL